MSLPCSLRYGLIIALVTTSAALRATAGETVVTSKYSNTKYGISFNYPSGYDVQEGALAGEHTLGYLGPIPMEFIAPGGTRVVTVIMPENSYPDTDFQTAFFTVSINQHVTRHECEQFPDVAGSKRHLEKKVSGINFHGVEQGSAAMSHQFGGNYYHGFSDGICYEVGYGVATAGYGAVEGIKHINVREVFATLDGILRSVVIRKSQS